MVYSCALTTNTLWQVRRRRALTAGITTIAAVSTWQRMTLTIRLLAVNASQCAEIWPASATKQNMILSGVSRKSSRFYRPLCKHCGWQIGRISDQIRIVFSVSQNHLKWGFHVPFVIFVPAEQIRKY